MQLKRVCADARVTAKPKANAAVAKATASPSKGKHGKGGNGQEVCETCKRAGHSAAECWWTTRHCDFCGKPGHLADSCFKNPEFPKYRGAAALASIPMGL